MPFLFIPYVLFKCMAGEARTLGGLLEKDEPNKKPSIPRDEKDE